MLEKYEKDFDENAFVKSFMERKQITTKQKALSELRKLIKKEGYYQSEIKEALKKKYPDAFVVKISQEHTARRDPGCLNGQGRSLLRIRSEASVVGIRSKLQEETVRKIQAAGGTAAFVRWPEEAIREVEEYEKSQR